MSEARRGGISASRLRGGDLDRRVWGMRSVRSVTAVALFAARLPTTVASHQSAAGIIGIPIPLRLELHPLVHLASMSPSRAPHAAGVVGHRLQLEADDILVTDGIRHTSPARTWRDLAGSLTLAELVAAGDYLIHWRLPLTSQEELARRARDRGGGRGAVVARRAADLLSDRSESPPESELRVLMHLAGLPAPRVNHVLVDGVTGREVRTDLALPEYRTVLEYQGDYHRARSQWRADMTRRTRLEARGWYVMEINADDLHDADELADRIRMILFARGWRSATPRRGARNDL